MMLSLNDLNQLLWVEGTNEEVGDAEAILAAPGANRRYIIYSFIFLSDLANVIAVESPSGTIIYNYVFGAAGGGTAQIWTRIVCPENAAVVFDNTAATLTTKVKLGYIEIIVRGGGVAHA